ncbi:MAG: metallophosphatase [Prevotellaceae bacterium]|jgi:5'-nucleotidase|nr:metallophosphatase [Prevotellaceae bacterium]
MQRISLLLLYLLLWVAAPLGAQQTKELLVLHTSDTHSRIEPIDVHSSDRNAGLGGIVRRATLVKLTRALTPDLLLFDCGDFSQGTPYYNLFHGEVSIRMMNLMGYDAMAIGNHEFDSGLENMARLYRMAEFPVVCANYDVTGTVLEGLVHPYVILQRNGLKIGVFGLSPQPQGLISAANYQGIVYHDPVAAAQAMSDLLRHKERCDVVICLSHLGFRLKDVPCDELVARQTSGIDLILGGHTHTFLEKPVLYINKEGRSVAVYHSGNNGVRIGQLRLTLEKKK